MWFSHILIAIPLKYKKGAVLLQPPFIFFMLCNYLEVASAIIPIKIPKTIMGIKLVIIEMPKVAKRDLLIWRLNNVKHTQNV